VAALRCNQSFLKNAHDCYSPETLLIGAVREVHRRNLDLAGIPKVSLKRIQSVGVPPRPSSFKPGHEKRGGRKRGTPNAFSADYKRAIIEAAYRIGNDGNGKDGVVGYFAWVALRHPRIFCTVLLINILPLEFAEDSTAEQPHWTKEESNERIRDYIGLASRDRAKRQIVQTESGSPWDWTGQDFPVGWLMQLAVENPKAFCTLITAAFLRPPTKWQRGLAARRAWEQRQQAGGER